MNSDRAGDFNRRAFEYSQGIDDIPSPSSKTKAAAMRLRKVKPHQVFDPPKVN